MVEHAAAIADIGDRAGKALAQSLICLEEH